MSDTLWPQGLQHTRLPWPSLTLGFCSDSCPLNGWCLPIISSFVVPLHLLPSVFPSIRSFPMSQLIASGGQSIGASAAAWVLPMNIQGWFPLGLTGMISLPSKGLSRVFSSTTSQRRWFFCAQPRINMNPHEPINLRTPSVALNFPLYPYRPASMPWDTNFFFFLSFDCTAWPGIEPAVSTVKAQNPIQWTAKEFLILTFKTFLWFSLMLYPRSTCH